MNYSNRIKNISPSFIREILKATQKKGIISFAGGLPNNSLFPFDGLQKATESMFQLEKAGEILQYSHTDGEEGLRGVIAKQFYEKSGLKVDCNNILITSGAQQAISLIAKLFLSSKETAGMEAPGYLGAKQAFNSNGNKIKEIGLDQGGIAMQELQQSSNLKLLYVNPNFQNPSGLSYSIKRRKELAHWINQNDTILLEDDPYGDLWFESAHKPISTLCSKKALYVGTYSKTLAPSLRVGYVIAKESFIKRLKILRQSNDLFSSNVLQNITLNYFHNNNFELHKKRLRRFYKSKRDCMGRCLDDEFGNSIEYLKPNGGFFFWVKFKGINTMELLEYAKAKEVLFVPGECFGGNESLKEFVRLNYSYSSNEEIQVGIKRMKTAYEELRLK